ncbi:MAG: archease [Armatimonadota bacterium]|nr:archease [Armatimonadota bacterium]MDR7451007.1 archease [Armatimonadota bacterium]MDR7465972.1 archease [Armatimonadota bacterium]MDR7494037.1 archease [Armatimonadota bacterium]MDR7498487.1 archease [Armatimonadota bacterium]
MTLHQLRVFATVARLGSFSRAAEELGITQPSVSIQVADLERDLGVELFRQEGKRIALTPAGQALAEYAPRILALADEAVAAVRQAGREPVAPFEVIEHTSEAGIIARGRTLPEVFANAAAGMLSFIISPESVRPVESRRIVVTADDREGLLVAWLNELLILLNGDGFIPREFRIEELEATRLQAEVRGEPVDPGRHRFRLDVKAATYHQLEIGRDGGWYARVIFDV